MKQDAATPLAERMRLHVPGQVTWPEPLLGRKCRECRNFDTRSHNSGPYRGRCKLVEKRYHIEGRIFRGTAVACPLFQEVAGNDG